MIHRFRLPKAVGVLGSVWLSGTAVGQDCGPVWQPLGSDPGGGLTAMVMFDMDGLGPSLPAVYVAQSEFTEGAWQRRVLRQSEEGGWAEVGGRFDGDIASLIEFDDDGAGSRGAMLYAVGNFQSVDGVSASRIARLSGDRWESVGPAIDRPISTAAVFDDDGAGPRGAALYIAGSFSHVGSQLRKYIARWDGASGWEPLSAGLSSAVNDLRVFDADGPGPEPARLMVGGQFLQAGGEGIRFIAAWDGRGWSALGDGVNAAVRTLALFDDDADPATPDRLAVGGDFKFAGGMSSRHIAVWDGAWREFAGPPPGRIVKLAAFGAMRSQLMALIPDSGLGEPNTAWWDGSSWRVAQESYGYTARTLASLDGRPAASGSFRFAMFGESFGGVAVFSPLESTPVITVQPYSQTVVAWHEDPVWMVESSGPGTVTYQWRHDGVPIEDSGYVYGSQLAMMRFHHPVLKDAGVYDCVVTNACGSTVSEPAVLTVVCPTDLNQDGHADWSDMLLFLDYYEAQDPRGDLDGDGWVGIDDYWSLLYYPGLGPC